MTPIEHALDAQKHLQDMFRHELAKDLPAARIALRKAVASLWRFDEDMVNEMLRASKEWGYRGADFDNAALAQYRFDRVEA